MEMNPNDESSFLRPEYDFPLNNLTKDLGARGIIYRAIPAGSLVLDVGCDTGRFGEALILHKQCVVDGIEVWPAAAEIARKRLNQVFVRSIVNEQSFSGLENYDVILFICVLEHLQDPWSALRGAFNSLKTNGAIYTVVPNISHISIVRRLLLGQFDYTNHGAMDRTHLRWFTRRSLKYSLEEAGFSKVGIQGISSAPYVGRSISNLLGSIFPDLFNSSILATGVKFKHGIL